MGLLSWRPAISRADLPSKFVGETKSYTFDFTSSIGSATISNQSCAAVVYSGTDTSPSSIINGVATASGAVVTQAITAGTEGVIYEVTCTVTLSDGQTLLQVGLIAVVPKD